MSGNTESLQSLLDWAKVNGAFINNKLSFENLKDRGVCCIIKESLNSEDTTGLIKIPQKLIISPAYCESFAQKYLNNIKITNENINVVFTLLLSRLKFSTEDTVVGDLNLSHFFKSYLNYLPNNGKETGNPYFWSLAEKELLDGTDANVFLKRNFLNALKEWKSLVSQLNLSDYPLLKDELLEYEAFKMGPIGGVSVDYLLNIKKISWTSFTGYLWASCIIKSRAFPYILFEKDEELYRNSGFLLPVVDLLNNEDENDSKCRWEIEDGNFVFSSLNDLKSLEKNMELFNSYGDSKTNLDYLLNYGFCIKNNKFETSTLTLKVDLSVIEGAKSYGVVLPRDDYNDDGINFVLKKGSDLPKNLIEFFAYLVKLTSEKKGFTLRMKLEGLTQLKAIIKTKLKTIKTIEVTSGDEVNEFVAKQIKLYRKSQKDIFQQSLEQIEKLEKDLLTKFKPFSFKKALQEDVLFSNAFILVWGLRKYNDYIEKGLVDHAVLLWIMRIANKDVYPNLDKSIFPDFIFNEFEKVKTTTEIDNEDIAEYLPMYEALFPSLCKKVPDVFDRGIWTLNHLIYASTVADRLTYKRETNGEVFFINPAHMK